VSDDIEVLHAASVKLRKLVAEAELDMSDWARDGRATAWRDGITNAVGGATGDLAGALGPGIARLMADLFDQWAWLAKLAPGFLARVGGEETIAMARAVIAHD
jgi:hypothetical protein